MDGLGSETFYQYEKDNITYDNLSKHKNFYIRTYTYN